MNIMLFAAGGDIGGAKTHILSLARELSVNNNLMLLSFGEGGLTEEGREMGLNIVVAKHGINVAGDIRAALAAVDRFHPDIIHCHGSKANMFGVLVKKFRPVPVMTTIHSDPKLDYYGSPLKQHTYGAINAIALRNMDFYLAVAERMEQKLIERGFDPQKIFTIYNGLDFSAADDTPKAVKTDEDEIVVGIAARLTPIKDIGTVIRAFEKAYRRNPKLRLRIAGTGEDEKDLKQLAKELKISEKVEFVGWISDMNAFFRGVDINVLASLSENFPYSLLEGAYEHCAAVASRVGGIPALINHGKNGYLFEPGEVDVFSDYLYKLSVDHGLRAELGENLFQKTKKEFSLERMCSLQEEVYRTILRRSARRGRQGAVICGAYGRGNGGDEAILKAILMQLRAIDEDMPFWVMSRKKKETRALNKTKSMYIFNVFAFIHSLRKARIFVNGGGSLIQDVTSSRSLYFYLFTLQVAKWCGCRIIMYGCGIGPITLPRNKKMAARILNRTADLITLRDTASLELLKEMKVQRPEILLAADPSVNLRRGDAEEVEWAYLTEKIPYGIPKIGFCLRNWPGFSNTKAIAAAADYAYEKYGVMPVFLPVEIPKDIGAADKVVADMKAPYYTCTKRHSVEELIGMLGSMKVVVGMRLHSLIFATAGGAPVIGISYDVKVESFVHEIDSAACIPLEKLTAQGLCEKIDQAMENGRIFSEKAAETLKKRELINREAARRLLEEGSRA